MVHSPAKPVQASPRSSWLGSRTPQAVGERFLRRQTVPVWRLRDSWLPALRGRRSPRLGEKRHLSLPGSRKPPSRLALRCTQSRRRPRMRATWAVFSGPIPPLGVRAAARSRSTSCSGEPAMAIGALLSAHRARDPATARRRRPLQRIEVGPSRPAGRPEAADRGLGHPMGETHVQIAQLPAESRRPRSTRFAFSLQIGRYLRVAPVLHTREVAGSKPAAPMN